MNAGLSESEIATLLPNHNGYYSLILHKLSESRSRHIISDLNNIRASCRSCPRLSSYAVKLQYDEGSDFNRVCVVHFQISYNSPEIHFRDADMNFVVDI